MRDDLGAVAHVDIAEEGADIRGVVLGVLLQRAEKAGRRGLVACLCVGAAQKKWEGAAKDAADLGRGGVGFLSDVFNAFLAEHGIH